MFERQALPRVLPFLAYMLFIALADVLGRFGWEAAQLRWMYALKIGVVAALLFAFRREYTELAWRGLRARAALTAVVSGVVGVTVWGGRNDGGKRNGTEAAAQPRTRGVSGGTEKGSVPSAPTPASRPARGLGSSDMAVSRRTGSDRVSGLVRIAFITAMPSMPLIL